MSSFLNIVIVGNLGGDPEMRYTPDGTPVCSFNVAVNRKWTGSDGNTSEKVTWLRVTCWRKLAESCNQYLSKGRQVLVAAGDIATSVWTDQEGKPRATLEVTARDVRFLGNGHQETDTVEEEEQEPAF